VNAATSPMKHLSRIFLALFALAAPGRALAQSDAKGFAIDRFDPSERGSEWFVLDSLDFRGNVRPALGAVADYAYKPLVFYDANGDEARSLVRHQLFVHVGGSLVLWDRLRVAANLPIAAMVKGREGTVDNTDYSVAQGGNIGDLRLSADVRLFGKYRGLVTGALGASVFLPTGSRAAYTGDGKVRIAPHAMLSGEVSIFAWAAKAGFNLRLQDGDLAGASYGSEVFLAGSAGLRFADGKLLVGPEVYASTVVKDGLFRRQGTPFEGIVGAHYLIKNQVRVGCGAGPGFTEGFGSPKMRIVGSLEWAPGMPEPKDRDHDGILDSADACPDEPGVASDDPTKNGCPLRDRDGDGIFDDVDACPDEPGAANDDPAKNGCPADRDGDGIPDAVDACPDEPGVASDIPEKNGCPADRDGDGIPDKVDACPEVPGPKNDDPTKNGCPPARIERGQIRIIEQVRFKTDSAEILPESDDILNAVRAIMDEHKEIDLVAIEGHTDNVGNAVYNRKLSEKRAASVLQWLVAHGIVPTRLSSGGYGMERPLSENESVEGRRINRRVEFHIRVVNGKPATSGERVEE
jgi:OOP family OmpA-OmpF porin